MSLNNYPIWVFECFIKIFYAVWNKLIYFFQFIFINSENKIVIYILGKTYFCTEYNIYTKIISAFFNCFIVINIIFKKFVFALINIISYKMVCDCNLSVTEVFVNPCHIGGGYL